MKSWKQLSIGGVIVNPGNAREFKTGSWKVQKPIWDSNICTHCMRCVIYCPEIAIKAKANLESASGGKVTNFDYDYCKGCGICAEECPVKAIKMAKE